MQRVRQRLGRVGAMAATTAAVIVASALASTGDLAARGCVEDTGQDECETETPGLDGARSVAVSPDGRSVYAASSDDAAIVRFNRER